MSCMYSCFGPDLYINQVLRSFLLAFTLFLYSHYSIAGSFLDDVDVYEENGIYHIRVTSDIAAGVILRLYKDPIVSSTTIQGWINQTKPGALKFINNLIKVGILELHRKGEGTRPSLYAHKEYLKIFTDK